MAASEPERGSELRQRRSGFVAPDDYNAGENSSAADEKDAAQRMAQTAKPPRRANWRIAGNTLKATLRLHDMGVDLANKEASLQRPVPSPAEGVGPGSVTARGPVFGDIQFSSGTLTHYCIIGGMADSAVVFDSVVNHPEAWNLEAPSLLLSIMGGAGNMDLDPAIENSFSEGLVRVAKQTGAWVITGGTDSGVMAIAARAMSNHDRKRTVPFIGITSFGSLKPKWRQQIDAPPDSEVKAFRLVDAPSIMSDEDKALAGIQEHHTHSIICDGGARGLSAYGQEVKFRAAFEQHVGRMFQKSTSRSTGSNLPCDAVKGNSAPRRSILGMLDHVRESSSSAFQATQSLNARPGSDVEGAEALRVMILLNGGAVSFESVDQALLHECPVVVCRNSGRAADFLAALKDKPDMSYEEAWELHMTAPADKKQWLERWSFEGPRGRGMLERIVTSDRLVVFSSNDRLEDVVIGAVLKNIWARGISDCAADHAALRVALQHSMDLAVRWQCIKHCRDLCARIITADKDAGFHNAVAWILGRMTTKEWAEADASHVMRLMFEGYPMAMKLLPIEALEPNHVRWTGVANFRDRQLRAQRAIYGEKDGADSTNRQDSLAPLFLWLIENGASRSVVDVMWLQQEYPAHAALAAASTYRQMAQGKQYPDYLEAEANRYEELAIKVVQGLDRIDTIDYLFNHSRDWGNHNLVTLAHHLECKNFVMEQFYVSAVDLLWFTPAPFEEYYFKKGKSANLMSVSFVDMVLGRYHCCNETALDMREFWSVPKVKALTHCLFRVLFIFSYSWYVLYSEGLSAILLRCLLFIWGVSLGLVEILQIKEKKSFADYINMWNVLDIFQITILLGVIICECLLVPIVFRDLDVLILHSLNLLPCYFRLLQMLELSQYFGTLLITVIDMYRDTGKFGVLLSVVSLGFSCALTPILWPTKQERWDQGVVWAFWAIYGDSDEKGRSNAYHNSVFGFMVPPLRYGLYLTLNVLLVNLLVAMLSDTFAAHKEESKRVWAFQCVDAVLEFASPETHLLPPPLDLPMSLHSLFFHDSQRGHKDEDFCWRAPSRQERRAIAQLQQKLLCDCSGSPEKEQNEQAEAMMELERQVRLACAQMASLSDSMALRDELVALRNENAALKEENLRLKADHKKMQP